MSQIPIRIASMGPADHGKSTLFGYLVLNHIKSGAYWKEIEKIEKEKEWFNPDRIYTYIFDRSSEEREGQFGERGSRFYQGASRVTTHVQCEIAGKKYLFIDVPGHDKFIKNATSGIFQAHSGVLVIAAPDLEDVIQTFKEKESAPKKHFGTSNATRAKISHALLCPILVRVYGFRNLILIISKMDRVKYDKYYFDLALEELLPRITKYSGLPKDTIPLIPISIDVLNRSDINAITPVPDDHHMSWYEGPSVLEVLTQIKPLKPSEGGLLIPIETVYLKRITNAPLILTGRIMRGTLFEGQIVQVIPLYDRSTTAYNPKRIEGRVKSILQRDQSKELPWMGKFASDDDRENGPFEAGHIIGLNLHLKPKFRWAKDNDNYFRKGCIITDRKEEIIIGNVIKAEIFIPIYSRPIIAAESWVIYLFGKNKGDAFVLSAHTTEGPFAGEDGEEYAGYFAEVDLLMDFTMAYPAWKGKINDYPKDIIMRHQQSFCGGHILELYFPVSIEVSWDEDLLYPKTEEIQKAFEDLARLKRLLCQWSLEQDTGKRWKLTAVNPSSRDIKVFIRKIDKMVPDISSVTITPNAKR